MLRSLEIAGIIVLSIKITIIIGVLLSFIYKWLIVPSVKLKKMGRWAVITGATDGIGKAFAEALAEKGMDIVLISRTKPKLDFVAQEIRKNHNVNTMVIAADFTESNAIYDDIRKELSSLDIGVLINNVGVCNAYPEQFLSLPDHEKLYQGIVQCNIVGVLAMCQIVLPGMCERRRGVVINVGSLSSEMPCPMFTVYAASKAFVSKFSLDLAYEYKKHGIVVQCLTPGFVATKISMEKEPSWSSPSPAKYVHSALRTVGIVDKTTGYWPHSLMLIFANAMAFISPTFAYWVVAQKMEQFRSREIKDKENIATTFSETL